jgi:transcriptional regulator with XRE-family HTH domain
MSQTQLAIQLGVSKGYISQVMKGEFNFTLKKLIELSLAVGKAPAIVFKPLAEFTPTEDNEVASSASQTLNRVADPIEPYPSSEK